MVVLFLALASLGAMEVTTQTPVTQVLQCLQRNAPEQLRIDDLRIEAKGRDVSTRYLSARFYSSRRDSGQLRAMLHITAPADLAGTRYLLVEESPEDALYLYLPALGKVRRVNGSGPEAEIAGTTLNYTDLRLVSQALSASSITLDRPTQFAGLPADVLRFSPAVADSPYRRILATVDRASCVILQADFQDATRSVKQYRIDPASLQRSGRYAYASRAVIEDLKRGSSAQISIGSVRPDAALSSRTFDPRGFYKVD